MIRIRQQYIDEMISHSLHDDPDECCGILAGNDNEVSQLYRIRNSTPSPYRYVMDPQEMLEAMRDSDCKGIELQAFYHSHTHSPAYPSETDTRMAVDSGWVDFCYILVSLENRGLPDVRFYIVDSEGEISEERVEII
ncbi:MAG: M67 family metallopeptidase [Chloroflexota bacterium]|nr:M67 family metallopeptidase [Chloroflexota bacterium]